MQHVYLCVTCLSGHACMWCMHGPCSLHVVGSDVGLFVLVVFWVVQWNPLNASAFFLDLSVLIREVS